MCQREWSALANAVPLDSAIFDGEVIAVRDRMPDFKALLFSQGWEQHAAFDLLWLKGRDLRDEPYRKRKAALRRLLAQHLAIGYVDEFTSPDLFEATVRLDLEGIVAKRLDRPYGEATEWVKVKHHDYSQMRGRWELFRKK